MTQTKVELDDGPVMSRPWGVTWFWTTPGEHLIRLWFTWTGVHRPGGDTAIRLSLPPGARQPVVFDAPRPYMGLASKWTVHPALALPAQGPPAGWFPDPYGAPEERYWDGTQWTDQVRRPG